MNMSKTFHRIQITENCVGFTVHSQQKAMDRERTKLRGFFISFTTREREYPTLKWQHREDSAARCPIARLVGALQVRQGQV